ncbi:protein YIPF6 isoform X1 [Canis lupus baileyi]|uniref:protein YIPF6 isoform X1 n=1 Tax=Canis lupus familiaris TaxID=9615 RepID=UPI0003ADDF01|nr:protein YIPF6 isoform X1 [Canis lupus familiaris]XP_025321857.1 protein YIPF6 isoform X1 [Canis lupus dingo]XP_038306114.1 protein YIPF6 isoform X1 [Canis lupus familiaris]XP_038443531.1 protein YIPF6 isoform X1 [Canis lupus familiaris]|eukprot:XP_022271478.1 protein YIPF6 isoform X1 [Canis lupus familiaris]
MAKAAESSGDPGTTTPRPLVSLGSATNGTEARCNALHEPYALHDATLLLSPWDTISIANTSSKSGQFAGLSDISISQDIPVEGEITIPMRSQIQEFDSSTLNESVQNTIMRDLKAVGKKFMHVLYPRKSNTLLRDWDLWGPLILCVTLALMLQRSSVDSEKDGGPQFAEVFVIVWFGAVTITLNSKLLGGNISFFQSLCVLGYCILPLTVAMLVCRLVLLAEPGPVNFMVRLFVVIVMFAWSIVASTAFLADSQPPNRKALAIYPVFLFYFVISWMILTFTPQ